MSAPLAIILESTVDSTCPQVEIDELRANSEEIGAALRALGYQANIIPFTLDIAAIRSSLEQDKPSVVFNLVDSIEGKGNLISLAPMLLAHMAIPFTGANALTTTTTCDKLLTKQLLKASSIPTPGWFSEKEIGQKLGKFVGPYIVKSITEHASFGIFADSVVYLHEELQMRLKEKKKKWGGEWFAEHYIEGREFNISVMAGDNGNATILPVAEIVFTSDFPKHTPHIVDYKAKWHEESAEAIGTVRNFEFEGKDNELLSSLKNITAACWEVFGLTGYARVDFRVDAQGKPYVLEVNSNPFLTACEGFGAAASKAGITFNEAIGMIVKDAYHRAYKPLPDILAA
jgi:D-alanine-D-alanine ligase